ncbi:Imm43 family immunity protein [Avibacterium avium]|uniref:Imm43 family immunity protein n=1 Tax=Avibacterium avium TaxID=751 RepID=UPI003BF92755
MKYYRLLDDIDYPSRWYLGGIHSIDNWKLINTETHEPNLMVRLIQDGEELDYTTMIPFNVPIVSEAFKALVENVNGLSFITIEIENKKTIKKYFAMIIHNEIACVDENRSEFTKIGKDDPVRPDLAGEYDGFYKLKLDYSKINKELFRLGKFPVAIIISERLKKEIEENCLTGAEFKEV